MRTSGVKVMRLLVAAAVLSACSAHAHVDRTRVAGKDVGTPAVVSLTFASADPNGNDTLFVRRLQALSGGAVQVVLRHYDGDAADVDVRIARPRCRGRRGYKSPQVGAQPGVSRALLRSEQSDRAICHLGVTVCDSMTALQ